MKAALQSSALAHQAQGTSESGGLERQYSRHGTSGVSGTYVRAVLPTEGPAAIGSTRSVEMAALTQGASTLDLAKVEGLRFEIEQGFWRADCELIARRVLEDGHASLEQEPDAG